MMSAGTRISARSAVALLLAALLLAALPLAALLLAELLPASLLPAAPAVSLWCVSTEVIAASSGRPAWSNWLSWAAS